MSDLDERHRRSEQMATNNRTPEAREKSRLTAIKTSARPEIIAARTKRLQSSYKPSKPERVIFELLQPLGFRWNCLISDPFFSKKTHRRQVDFINHTTKTMIEFDGGHHFRISWKRMPLEEIQKNDHELDIWAQEHGYMLIRIGHTQFKTRDENLLCWSEVANKLKNFTPGVFCFGSEYGERNVLRTLEEKVE